MMWTEEGPTVKRKEKEILTRTGKPWLQNVGVLSWLAGKKKKKRKKPLKSAATNKYWDISAIFILAKRNYFYPSRKKNYLNSQTALISAQ